MPIFAFVTQDSRLITKQWSCSRATTWDSLDIWAKGDELKKGKMNVKEEKNLAPPL